MLRTSIKGVDSGIELGIPIASLRRRDNANREGGEFEPGRRQLSRATIPPVCQSANKIGEFPTLSALDISQGTTPAERLG